jgi:endonuclease/exonuclease/phosphatase family metal-dependent hydrolase
VLSWNLRDLLGDPLALARVVRAAGPDVACFQEAPRRPGAALRLRGLERRTGLRCVAGGRRSGGTAIFVGEDVEVDWARAFRLPVAGCLTRTRGACVADVRVPANGPATASATARVTVASVHLPLQPGLRVLHARLTAAVVSGRGRPAVIAGDLNEPAGERAWRCWAPLADDPWPSAAPTFPARGPDRRIDAVLTGPGLQVTSYGEGDWSERDVRLASDHRPVLAVIMHEGGDHARLVPHRA